MAKARTLLNKAIAAATTDQQKFLAGMYDRSLKLFEQFMQLRQNLAQGKFPQLQADADAYLADMTAAMNEYQAQYAFSGETWLLKRGGANCHYFRAFYEGTYRDATRLATQGQLLTPTLRQWKWMQGSPNNDKVPDEQGGFFQPDFQDETWKATDVSVDTWSALGLHNYMGSAWYRRTVQLPAELPAGKKIFLWIGATDGSARVWINGREAAYLKPVLDDKKQPTGQFTCEPQAEGFCMPFSFDLTGAVQPGDNQITILCRRTFFNELGTGGLLAAPVVYAE